MKDQILMLDFVNESLEQIKLSSISVLNWGPLHGLHEVRIDPEGTLITGDNGAGKSTLVDALMTLLRPSGSVSYNIAAAQDSKKDRSIVTYIRGSYGNSLVDGEQVLKNLREDSVISAVKAVYEFSESKRKVVLLGIFSIRGNSNANADVRKIYSIANEDIDVIEAVKSYKSLDIKPLKAFLLKHDNCHVYENFTEYETAFRLQLRMDNENAPALLSRAVGLKRIDDLTSLIRTLVLEKGHLDEDAREAIASFDDLKAIHEILLDLYNQEKDLKDLPDRTKNYEELAEHIKKYSDAEKSLNAYAAKFACRHCEALENKLNNSLSQLDEEITYTLEDKQRAVADRDTKHQLYLEHGGSGTQNLEQALINLKNSEKKIKDCLDQYNQLASNLNFKIVKNKSDYEHNLSLIPEFSDKLDEETKALVVDLARVHAKEEELKERKSELDLEKNTLLRRNDSNLDMRYQNLRYEISRELNISEESLVYVAELIEVKSEYKVWQGAIERALGGRRQTLLVDESEYKAITGFINSKFWKGIHVRVQTVHEVKDPPKSFGNLGYLNRLNFKEHRFTPFLKSYLINHDLTCVDSVEELNATDFSMTIEGMIHYHDGYYEKKDLHAIDDRHKWCLGFSNKDKIKLIDEDLAKTDTELNNLSKDRSRLNVKQNRHKEITEAFTLLRNFKSFKEIDVENLQAEIRKIQSDFEKLASDPDTLKFKKAFDEATAILGKIDSYFADLQKQRGEITAKLNDVRTSLNEYKEIAKETVSEDTAFTLNEVITNLKLSENNFYEYHNKNNVEKEISRLKDNLTSKRDHITADILKIINGFSNRHPDKVADWGSGFESYPYYLNYLDKIRKDNLPKQLDRFKTHLTQTGTEAVVSIVSKANAEISAIKDRVRAVNAVLKRAEFDTDSYLEIEAKPLSYPALTVYEKETREVMNKIQSEDHEDRYKRIAKVIDSLNDALSSSSIEKKAILDTRLRLQFIAHVVNRKTNLISDTMTSSSGKSGGEKESFAGSVLAASLAYVLTPQNGSFPTYSTVFLDEAFSNTSDKVSSRVLQTFKELKLHVNLITPYKNIGLSREYTRTLIMLSKNDVTHMSTTNTMSWEEHDEKQKHRTSQAMKELGININ